MGPIDIQRSREIEMAHFNWDHLKEKLEQNISSLFTSVVEVVGEYLVPRFEINLMEPLDLSIEDIEADLGLDFDVPITEGEKLRQIHRDRCRG